MRRVEDRTRMDTTYVEKLLNNFLNFIFWGKGMKIGKDIIRKDGMDKGNRMIMKTT
jgi:hypothetical protein